MLSAAGRLLSPLDETLARLVGVVHDAGAALEIVSDGVGFHVERMLARLGLADLPVATNATVLGRGGGGVSFPYGHPACLVCGTCKRERVRLHQVAGRVVVFVGDGPSDRYAAHHADVVFAKAALAAWCRAAGIPFEPWTRLVEGGRSVPSRLWPMAACRRVAGWPMVQPRRTRSPTSTTGTASTRGLHLRSRGLGRGPHDRAGWCVRRITPYLYLDERYWAGIVQQVVRASAYGHGTLALISSDRASSPHQRRAHEDRGGHARTLREYIVRYQQRHIVELFAALEWDPEYDAGRAQPLSGHSSTPARSLRCGVMQARWALYERSRAAPVGEGMFNARVRAGGLRRGISVPDRPRRR